MIRRITHYLAAMVVASTALTAVSVAPAQAVGRSDDLVIAGSGANVIKVRLYVSQSFIGPSTYETTITSRMWMGANATSATGCKVTAWVRLMSNDAGSPQWDSPRVTHDCKGTLPYYNGDGRWVPIDNGAWRHWHGRSSGSFARGRVCVDLYYNHSSSSGAQGCANSPDWVSWG